jgi:pimeloyl-ACP methyl ester carboxylesterase
MHQWRVGPVAVIMACMQPDSAEPLSVLQSASPVQGAIPRHVVFSHGLESGPWGRKISVLAEIARSQGYEAHSVDYRGMRDPRERVARLVEFWTALPGDEGKVLAGSSMGGYVSLAAALQLSALGLPPARGLFLIAPALYLEGLPPLPSDPLQCPVAVVHGWRDEVVPFMDSVRFGSLHDAALHLMAGDHLLHEQLPVIQTVFERFLLALA